MIADARSQNNRSYGRNRIDALLEVGLYLLLLQLLLFVVYATFFFHSRFAPIGIMSLIAAQFGKMEDISGLFESLALFMVTVTIGVFSHGFIVLPIIFWVMTRKSPLKMIKGVTEALTTAFGTASR